MTDKNDLIAAPYHEQGCDCPRTSEMDGEFMFTFTEPFMDWLGRNDPLPRSQFDTIKSSFIRTVGDPISVDGLGENKHIRVCDADEAGQFASEKGTILIELDDDTNAAELFGYPYNGGMVPILCTCSGENPKEMWEQLHNEFHIYSADLPEGKQPIPDGGTELKECGCPPGVLGCEHDLSDDERAAQAGRYFEKLCQRPSIEWDKLRLFRTDGKNKKLNVFNLGEGALSSDKSRYYEYTADEAIEAIRAGASGFALYMGKEKYGTENLGVIDNDDTEKWPYHATPSDYKILSGSGEGYHHPFVHDGSVSNANTKKETPYEGSIRTSNYYHLIPGSIHPSGGVYMIEQTAPVPEVTKHDFPTDLHPRSRSHVTGPDGEKLEIPRSAPDELEDVEFENDLGMSLEQIREKDDKLDRLLDRLAPPGYNGDRSAADAAAVAKLWFWEFDREQIGQILRKYRLYEKTERDDYLYEYTIPFATGGDQLSDRLDEGEDPKEYDPDPDPLGILPVDALTHLSHDDRRRFAKRRGVEWPGVDEVRNRLSDSLVSAIENEKTVVISSPTGSGKTHAASTEPWLDSEATDDQPVIHAHKTKEARDKAAQKTAETPGIEGKALKGREELCPLAAGDFDPDNRHGNRPITIDGIPVSQWIDNWCDNVGVPYSVVHQWVEQETDRDPLPCMIDCECESKTQYEGVPRDDDGYPSYDVVHCTHAMLLVPSLRMHTNVIIDEKPSFNHELDPERARTAVSRYLKAAGSNLDERLAAPVDNYQALVHASEHGGPPGITEEKRQVEGVMLNEWKKGFEEQMLEALEFEPDIDWYRRNPDCHTLAPAIARAIWHSEEVADGRRFARVPYNPPRLDDHAHDHSAWNRVYVDVVLDPDGELAHVETIPDFYLSRSVVGLDAHPQPEDPVWQANVDPTIETERVLDQTERALYRRYERGLFVVQTGEGTQPITSGRWLDEGQGKKIEAIVDRIVDGHDEFSTAITSKSAKDFLRRTMEENGITDPQLMHYGEEESRNDFAGEEVGFVAGSIDPGDENVMNLVARLKADAQPVIGECGNCDGSGRDDGSMCKTCDGDGETRERGRTFEGDDAEVAEWALECVRETHVAQAAGRWARNAEDPDDNAIVYLMTDAAPTGFVDAKAPGATWVTNEDQRDRLQYVANQPTGSTAREVAEETGCSKTTAIRTLQKAAEEGLLTGHPGAGKHGATIFTPTTEFTPVGSADLTPDGQTVADNVEDTYTWTVTIESGLVPLAEDAHTIRDPLADIVPIGRFAAGPPPD